MWHDLLSPVELDIPTLYSLQSVAEAAGVKRDTIYNWLAAGRVVPSFYLSTRKRRIPVFTEDARTAICCLAKVRCDIPPPT